MQIQVQLQQTFNVGEHDVYVGRQAGSRYVGRYVLVISRSSVHRSCPGACLPPAASDNYLPRYLGIVPARYEYLPSSTTSMITSHRPITIAPCIRSTRSFVFVDASIPGIFALEAGSGSIDAVSFPSYRVKLQAGEDTTNTFWVALLGSLGVLPPPRTPFNVRRKPTYARTPLN